MMRTGLLGNVCALSGEAIKLPTRQAHTTAMEWKRFTGLFSTKDKPKCNPFAQNSAIQITEIVAAQNTPFFRKLSSKTDCFAPQVLLRYGSFITSRGL
jgi:hypothetical protein